ncbi:MAG TPA: SGNH/GDSL hydrolase family protein [Roseimicrobium sp.]|nr:SGNH/GDSL hydrolase family protein [Roseimicrobium sp.]
MKPTLTQISRLVLIALLHSVLLCTLTAAEPRIVVIFGDSITEGGALPLKDRPLSWVNRVAGKTAGKWTVVNEGKGGRPTNSVKEFEAMLKRNPKAHTLIIALGTNDSRDITDQCVPKAVANLRAMVALAREAWGKELTVWIVGPPNIRKDALGPTKPIANERDAKLRELGTGFESLAKELGCNFMTLYGVVPESSLTKDGVHPDAAGNEPIAEAVLAKLK